MKENESVEMHQVPTWIFVLSLFTILFLRGLMVSLVYNGLALIIGAATVSISHCIIMVCIVQLFHELNEILIRRAIENRENCEK